MTGITSAEVEHGSSHVQFKLSQPWRIAQQQTDSAWRALLPEGTGGELVAYENHIESCMGAVKLPVGIAGPLRVKGVFASGDYYVPLATTEAALVASYSRGAQVITEAGGCVSVLLHEGVSRTPGFVFRSLVSAELFAVWCIEHRADLHAVAAQTTEHGELTDVGVAIEGNHV